jgi:hypothetical protein
MLAFGGMDNTGVAADTWVLHLETSQWESLSATGVPARWIHSAIFDAAQRRMIVFGGYSEYSSRLNDTWDLSLDPPAVWRQTVPPITNPPSARHDYAAAYDPIRRRLVLFGGNTCTAACYQSDTWLLALSGPPIWTNISSPGPAPRFGATLVYDSARDRMLLFGGGSATSCGQDQCLFNLNDTWALPLSGSRQWDRVAPAGPLPPERYYHSAIYDPVRDQMLIYGGDGYNLFADLWALTLSGTPRWQMVSAGGTSPGQRYEHAATYDPARDRMLLLGGADFTAWHNDVWALSLTGTPAWDLLAPEGSAPAPRGRFACVYDSLGDRLILFGGVNDLVVYNDTWSLALSGSPAWARLLPSGGPPSPRGFLSGVYDGPGDRVVFFGGGTAYQSLADLWALAWGRVTAVPPPPPHDSSFHITAPTIVSTRRAVPVSVTTPASGPCSLSLFDMSGRRVWTRDIGVLGPGTAPLSVSVGGHVHPGLYLLVARQAAFTASQKICVLSVSGR